MNASTTSYDDVAYPSYTHVQTHPDRLAVIGTLFGLKPAPVTRCRVLELGCGNASNLVPMAFGLPESHFVGIDLAASAVARGQQMIRDLHLPNIQLIHGSVAEIGRSPEKFDYIIAHGLYSWVPPEVRTQVLEICRQCLAPHGIAFISYNALPGSHLRSMLREMMLFHVRGIEAPQERIRQATALAHFLATASNTTDEYQVLMQSEIKTILGHEPGHLYHDELAEMSDPFYFVQFVEASARQGLQYLGEADYFEMFDHGFSAQTRSVLQQLSGNRISREQYLDFLKCRRFRQTLLCHSEASLNAAPDPAKVATFFISSTSKRTDAFEDLHPGKIMTYASPKGARCSTDLPLGKAALQVLAENEHNPLHFDELAAHSIQRLAAAGLAPGAEDPRGQLSGFMLELHGAGTVDFRTWRPEAAHAVSNLPVVSPLARWQVQQQPYVTSQFHVSIRIEDEIGKFILAALDGSLDRTALVDKILALLKTKNALAADAGDEPAVRRKVETDLDANLQKLARLGLLIA